MATRVRQSTAGPSQRRSGLELPPYESPSFALNPAAQRALAQLQNQNSLKKLDEALLEAQGALSNAAAEINDRLTAKERTVEKRKHEHSSQDGGNDISEELEKNLGDLRDRVQRMTQRMDEHILKMIDGRHSLQFVKDSLAAASDDARANASTQASTQVTRSQRTRQRRAEDNAEDEDEQNSDGDYQDFEPTDPAAQTQRQTSYLNTFTSKLEDARTRYQSHSRTARYAENNEYRDFRRVVHDAQHPDGDVPLAHHTEWFEEQAPPAPGVTTRARTTADEDDDDDDDDIAVSRATISTRCPLTLQEFKTPLSSRKCPHSFESEAIMSMINGSNNRVNNRPNGERFVQCPVTGCSQTLTRADLHTDNVLVRRIARIQRARELEDEDGHHAPGRGKAQEATVIDDADDGEDVDAVVHGHPPTQMKIERPGVRKQSPPLSTAPSGSAAVVDLGGESTDEEAEEEDESMEE